jgi:hypothetical protein
LECENFQLGATKVESETDCRRKRMPNQSNDDVARALSDMAVGQQVAGEKKQATGLNARNQDNAFAAPSQATSRAVRPREIAPRPINDDDVVISRVAPAKYSGDSSVALPRQMHVMNAKSLRFRRTIIPVLLTTALMLAAAGSLRFVVGEESSLAEFPIWMSLTAYGAAALLMAVAVLNMLHVRHELGTTS